MHGKVHGKDNLVHMYSGEIYLTFTGPPANSEEGALLRGSHSKPCEEGDREMVRPTLKAKMEQVEFSLLIWAV